MASVVEVQGSCYVPVPLRGLSGRESVPFPLFLSSGGDRLILYQPGHRPFGSSHEDRLAAEGIEQLYIRVGDRASYSRRVEHTLDLLLRDRSAPIDDRADLLVGVAHEVCRDLVAELPGSTEIDRLQYVMSCTSSWVVRDRLAMRAIRAGLPQGSSPAEHGLSVGILAIGLAQELSGGDPAELTRFGMAGALHDVGRAGRPDDASDHLHTARGYHLLRRAGMAREVCDAALFHHERFDGSGFPDGLVGEAIPRSARVVGLVDTFHRIYDDGASGDSVFGALRVLAQVYRGCFDPGLIASLLQLFRGA